MVFHQMMWLHFQWILIFDTFSRLNLSSNRLCGLCYDGASSMVGAKSGITQRISDIESWAVIP